MATSKSPLGEPSKPRPPKQGGMKKAPTQAPRVQSSNGNSAPALGDQSKRRGVRVKPQGGSGTGGRKGNSLPR